MFVQRVSGLLLFTVLGNSLCCLIALIVVREAAHAQQQWEFMGLGYEKINTIAVDPRNFDIVYAGSQSIYADTFGLGGIFKSTNGGMTWDTVAAPASVSKIVIHPTNSSTVYAALNSANFMRPGIVKTTDAGHSWFYADSGMYILYPAYFRGIAIDAQHPETLYCGEGGDSPRGLWKTTTGGAYWFLSDSGMRRDYVVGQNIVIDPESTNVVYTLTGVNGAWAWRTTNGGGYWYNLGIPWNAYDAGVLEMDPHNPATLYVVAVPGESPPQVAKTTNKGATWQLMSFDTMGIGAIVSLAIDPDNQAVWYAGAEDVYRSSDGGTHWQLMTPPLGGIRGVYALAFAPGGCVLYAGTRGGTATGSGVFRYRFITEVPQMGQTSWAPSLYQNYPNPFNSTTTMKFDIPVATLVSLKVYDVLGRAVAVLAEGRIPAGKHTVSWEANGIPSGVYIARLQADKLVRFTKLLLLR
jgi:hypothetical protein